jgi:hypothetical protein
MTPFSLGNEKEGNRKVFIEKEMKVSKKTAKRKRDVHRGAWERHEKKSKEKEAYERKHDALFS